jgi:hypothetical protein
VIEVRMSLEDAKSHAHRSVVLEDAIEDAMREHMRVRSTINRNIAAGAHR